MYEPKAFAVYMMTNTKRGVLYVGVTSNLVGRVYQHRTGAIEGFTKRWALKRLVWFEPHMDAHEAIAREKRIKRWRRAWKFNLIEAENPEWADLWPGLTGEWAGGGGFEGPGQSLRDFRDDNLQ